METTQFEHVDITDTNIKFHLCSTTMKNANRLRQIYISKIPVVAITNIQFTTNTGIMHDQILDHRIMSVPVYSSVDPSTIDLPIDACVSMSVVNDNTEDQDVLSDNILITNTMFRIPNGDILLTRLKEGQCIKCTGDLSMGTGIVHTNYSAVSAIEFDEVGVRDDLDNRTFTFDIETIGCMDNNMLFDIAVRLYEYSA